MLQFLKSTINPAFWKRKRDFNAQFRDRDHDVQFVTSRHDITIAITVTFKLPERNLLKVLNDLRFLNIVNSYYPRGKSENLIFFCILLTLLSNISLIDINISELTLQIFY